MSYAFVKDVAASWERYRSFADAISSPPRGLILHAAGPTDEGYRIIEVWESRQAWLRFRQDALGEATADDDALPSAPSFRDLEPAHLVCGQSVRNARAQGGEEPRDSTDGRAKGARSER